MDRIWNSTQRATNSMSAAAGTADTLNSHFAAQEGAVSKLTTAITGLVSAYLSFEGIKQAMSITDEYVNTTAKLSLITNSLTQQKDLQNQIFAAADRSRGSYAAMADTVGKLGIIAGSQFGGTQNIVKFTETMQKMFKIGGTSTANQSGAMLQLQQAIGLGKLQGNDFRILAEDAPLVEKAVSKYMDTSIGKVRQLSTEGKITSQVLIDSILDYSKTTDAQFKKMPMTFGDIWNKISNGAMQAFGSTFSKISGSLNSTGMQSFVNGLISAFYALAGAANKVLDAAGAIYMFFSNNWGIIAPIILGIAGAFAVLQIPVLLSAAAMAWNAICSAAETIALFAMTVATDGLGAAFRALNATLFASPLTWILLIIIAIIAAIYIVVAIIDKVTGQSISATGVIVGCLYWIGSLFQNIGLGAADVAIGIWNAFLAATNNIKIGFTNAWAEIQTGFWDFIGGTVTGIKTIIDWINKIPGVNINTNGLSSTILNASNSAAKAWASQKTSANVGDAFSKGLGTFQTNFGSLGNGKAYMSGYNVGTGLEKSVGNAFNGLGSLGKSTLGTSANPTVVKGTGSGGNVTVNIADQDLQYMRDLAEKQYVNQFSTAVLSPKISLQVTNASEQDDKKLATRMQKILKEQIAVAAKGKYD
jgi:tape measure domain